MRARTSEASLNSALMASPSRLNEGCAEEHDQQMVLVRATSITARSLTRARCKGGEIRNLGKCWKGGIKRVGWQGESRSGSQRPKGRGRAGKRIGV
eukprot:6011957-Pleurochrysis_carterae.AAC.2